MTQTSNLSTELADAMIAKSIWQPECPIAMDRLAAVTIKYVDFDGNVHEDGQMVVHDAVAARVERIFARLFEIGFPIAKIVSMDHYNGDDDLSMADNNSSCFNFRQISGSQTVSMHGYGLAIDVNPLQNPFVTFEENEGIAKVNPPAGWQYLNRHNQKPGMLESVVSCFEENGFAIWGGRWTTPIDFHHFQPPRVVADLLTVMDRENGIRVFEICAKHYKGLATLQGKEEAPQLVKLFQRDHEAFFDKLTQLVE